MRESSMTEPAGDLWEAAGNVIRMQARAPGPAPVPRISPLPLSPAQERLWYLCRRDPLDVYYHVPLVWRVEGPLDAGVLRGALDAMAARHEILRTTFHDGPAARIHPPAPFDLTCLEAASFAEAVELADSVVRRPFDLEHGPLCRAVLVRFAPAQHLLVTVFHQMIFDGASMRIWNREMVQMCRADAAPPGAMRLQYADFVAWKRRLLEGEFREAHLAYWRDKLRNPYAAPALPADRPRSASEVVPGGKLACEISPALTARLARLAADSQATIFNALVAALQLYLYSLTGQTDVMLFASVADRADPALSGLIGLLANVVPIRTDLSGNPSFREALRRARESCLGAFAWQALPLADIIELLPRNRGVFQLMLIYQGTPLPPQQADGVTFTPIQDVDTGAARFDLLLDMARARDTIRGTLKYRGDIFEEPTVRRLWNGFVAFLERSLGSPDALTLAARCTNTPAAGATASQEFVAPRDPLEQQLAEWCAQAFGVKRVGATENFFDLGADSLAAVRMLRRIESLTGIALPLAALVQAPTVERLATLLRDCGYTAPARPRRFEALRKFVRRD